MSTPQVDPRRQKPEDWAKQFAFFEPRQWKNFPEIGTKAIYPLAQLVVETIANDFRQYLERFPKETQELLLRARASLSETPTAQTAREIMTLLAHCAENYKTVSKRPYFGFGTKLLALRRLELLFREESKLLGARDQTKAQQLEQLHDRHFPEFVLASLNPNAEFLSRTLTSEQ